VATQQEPLSDAKAIVVTDQAAGTTGMTLAERPEHFNATFRTDHYVSGD
jgi:hypothetical protein